MAKMLKYLMKCRRITIFKEKGYRSMRGSSVRKLGTDHWNLLSKLMKVFCNKKDWMKRPPSTKRDLMSLKRTGHPKTTGTC